MPPVPNVVSSAGGGEAGEDVVVRPAEVAEPANHDLPIGSDGDRLATAEVAERGDGDAA